MKILMLVIAFISIQAEAVFTAHDAFLLTMNGKSTSVVKKAERLIKKDAKKGSLYSFVPFLCSNLNQLESRGFILTDQGCSDHECFCSISWRDK